RRVDALNPERAEIALAVSPVAIGVLQPLLDAAQRQPETDLAAPPVALRLGDDLLLSRLGGDSTLDPCHASSPELREPPYVSLRFTILTAPRAARARLRCP